MSPRRQATADPAAPADEQDRLAEPSTSELTTPPKTRGTSLPTRVPASQRRTRRPSASKPASGATADGPALARRTSPADPVPPEQVPASLSARLVALARLIQIGAARSGREGFSKKLLSDAEDALGRAGDRMRLSSAHTVVVLAGGTGSGKSSLFNKLAGASFSAVGVTRPITTDPHACIWGVSGSGGLLDWLAVPPRNRYSRESALDKGEADLAGLVLLDLPDHDSVLTHAHDQVDRLVRLADMMVWVLDPQKYADAAVHRRFLVPMAGHSAVLAVVLNQADLLDQAEVDDCVADLRRLLDSENLPDVPILVTSAVTGVGLDDLRKLLVNAVAARRAAAARISADVDGLVARFARYAGDETAQGGSVSPDAGVSAASQEEVAEKFAAAAGASAVSDALRSARELRAADFIGWPIAWLAQRLTGRDPLRKARLSLLWNDLRAVSQGPSGAQQAEIDNALSELGERLGDSLPAPWSRTVRAAARSKADQIPAAIGEAIGQSLPPEKTARWWMLGDLWQGVLAGAAAIGVIWLALIPILHGLGVQVGALPGLNKLSLMPWIAAGIALVVLLGWLTENVGLRLVRRAAVREHARVAAVMLERIAAVVASLVVIPVEQELSELKRYREELAIAQRGLAA